MRFDVHCRQSRPPDFALDARFVCETDSLAIVGPSGAGKSTLLEILAGVQPAQGHVRLDGAEQLGVALHTRRVGYVTQDAALFPHLDVAANLRFSPHAGPLDEVVDALHLGPLLTRFPRHLSGGERRRVALARALVSRPSLLLLDEPFAGLDAQRRRDALSTLHAVRRAFPTPLVLVSHVAEEIVGVAEIALRLDAGQVVACGPAASVLRAGETRVDNHLRGRVTGPHAVDVDGCRLEAALPTGVSGDVRLACFAHDILLARERPGVTSARNVLQARVESLQPAGDAVLVELHPPRLVAMLTPRAVEELDLRVGSPAWLLIKATSISHLGPA